MGTTVLNLNGHTEIKTVWKISFIAIEILLRTNVINYIKGAGMIKTKRKVLCLLITAVIFVMNIIMLFRTGISLDEGATLATFMSDSFNILATWLNIGLSALLLLLLVILPSKKD